VGCDEREWRRVHLPPFAAAVGAGVAAVMTAHVRIPVLDVVPATISRHILDGLLRRELGFDGVIVTDALDMAGISAGIGDAGAAVAALAAGADALCLGAVGGEAQYQRVRAAVAEAVRAGGLLRARLARAAERVAGLPARVPAPDAGLAPTARGDPGLATARGDPGLAAARAAAAAHRVRPLAGRPVVVELRAVPNPAVGEAAWDLTGPLAALGRPPRRTVRITAERASALDSATLDDLAAAGPPVVVGRDVVRHDWQRRVWDLVRARRADAVLVDLGLPRPDRLPDAPYVLVGGAARPNLRVAAEILVAGRTGP
jgi:beta-N-acetylhexosaminidase